MKKIIRNKVYDTSKAHFVGIWTNSWQHGDLDYEDGELYRKRTGEYFLAEFGGARTRFAERDSLGGWRGSTVITPLAYERAREWAEGHLDAGDYLAEFGEPEDGQAVLHAAISAKAKSAIECAARRDGITIAQQVERMAASL